MIELPNPENWEGTVWHTYAETAQPNDTTSTRDERLQRQPDAIFHEPTHVADWIEDMTRRHAIQRTVHLLDGGGTAETGDLGQREQDFDVNLDILHQGDSVYVEFHHATNRRMHLWVEAIHAADQEVHSST